MKDKFEYAILDSGDLMRRAGLALVNNAGRAITIITLLVASLVTFTDLTFGGFGAKNFTALVIIMLTASYLIYFSMEDTGEKTGEESPEFQAALKAYSEAREKISADKMTELRDFCKEYSRAELEYRRDTLLMSYGESREDFMAFLEDGCEFSRKKRKIFKKIARLRAVELSPKTLLSREHTKSKSELSNPEIFKLLRLALKLIPTTLCMLLTVSIIPSVKENMTFSAVVEGILKLSSLPIVAFRGYSTGYFYAKRSKCLWIETKTRLLMAFIKQAA
ncbi:MAG: hypothetical protein IJW38_04215 [Clostridia bacterium]|nr:hypothetical protein [Clostridia bacterium]